MEQQHEEEIDEGSLEGKLRILVAQTKSGLTNNLEENQREDLEEMSKKLGKENDSYEISRSFRRDDREFSEPIDLNGIVNIYEKSLSKFDNRFPGIMEDTDFSPIYRSTSRFRVRDKKDIHQFVSILPQYEDKARRFSLITGAFLSGLIHNLKEGEECVLDLTNLHKPLDYLGMRLFEFHNLIIKGDVGDYLGYEMDGGKITVEGNAGDDVGQRMWRGEILVCGNVGDELGRYMLSGSKVTVEGNAGKNVGNWMEGGEILIKGNAGHTIGYEMSGGKITVEGDTGCAFIRIMGGTHVEIHLNGKYGWAKPIFLSRKGGIYHKGWNIYPGVDDENEKSQFYYGHSILKKGDIQKAKQHFETGLEYKPEGAWIRLGLSDCYIELAKSSYEKGEFKEAEKQLEKAVELRGRGWHNRIYDESYDDGYHDELLELQEKLNEKKSGFRKFWEKITQRNEKR